MRISVIYKLTSRTIVVPPGMTRVQLMSSVGEDWRDTSRLRELVYPFIYGKLRSPWTLEYVDGTPCDLVKS